MAGQDIRWVQRFSNYRKAMLTLSKAADLASTRALTNLEQQGLIQGPSPRFVKIAIVNPSVLMP